MQDTKALVRDSSPPLTFPADEKSIVRTISQIGNAEYGAPEAFGTSGEGNHRVLGRTVDACGLGCIFFDIINVVCGRKHGIFRSGRAKHAIVHGFLDSRHALRNSMLTVRNGLGTWRERGS